MYLQIRWFNVKMIDLNIEIELKLCLCLKQNYTKLSFKREKTKTLKTQMKKEK